MTADSVEDLSRSLRNAYHKGSGDPNGQEYKFKLVEVSEEPVDVNDFIDIVGGVPVTKTYMRSRLILLSQLQKSDDLIVLGMQLDEYLVQLENGSYHLFLYIAKLDSTGVMEPRTAQRDLIHATLAAYLKQYVSYKNLDVSVYCYARSNPEYLFPDSSLIKTKGKLEGRKLVYWWKSMFEKIIEFKDECFWLIPGLEKGQLPREHRDETLWKYSHPFGDGEAKALSAIPKFLNDDSKSKCLKRSVDDTSITVDTFFNGILPANPDFVNADVGLFVIRLKRVQNHMLEDVFNFWSATSCTESGLSDKLNVLLDIGEAESVDVASFKSKEEVVKSSKRILELCSEALTETTLKVPTSAPAKKPEKRSAPEVQVNWLQVKRKK